MTRSPKSSWTTAALSGLGVAAVLAAALAPAGPALAAAPAPAQPAPVCQDARTSFISDGQLDEAVGVPGEDRCGGGRRRDRGQPSVQ